MSNYLIAGMAATGKSKSVKNWHDKDMTLLILTNSPTLGTCLAASQPNIQPQ